MSFQQRVGNFFLLFGAIGLLIFAASVLTPPGNYDLYAFLAGALLFGLGLKFRLTKSAAGPPPAAAAPKAGPKPGGKPAGGKPGGGGPPGGGGGPKPGGPPKRQGLLSRILKGPPPSKTAPRPPGPPGGGGGGGVGPQKKK